MDINILKDSIISEDGKSLSIISQSETDILTDDWQFDKKINYHLVKPTDEWVRSLFFYSSSIDKSLVNEDLLVDYLLKIDAAMLINLQHIIFFEDTDDIADICFQLSVDEEFWPEIMFVEDDEVPTAIGCYWNMENSIIIYVSAIKRTLSEMEKECENNGEYFNRNYEMHVAISTTLLHEVRHLGLENPFLLDDKYPEYLKSEENVESWAIEQFETIS